MSTQPPIYQEADRTEPGTVAESDRRRWAELLRQRARNHACYQHPLFTRLETSTLTPALVSSLLCNYDAHAAVLRRLLLSAATLMPDDCVHHVIENVRNEYGNGDPARRHALQLRDLALKAGAGAAAFDQARVAAGVRDFIEMAGPLYFPENNNGACAPAPSAGAVSAGAITATELLAAREFQVMQAAFARIGHGHHIWFDHVATEIEHGNESLELALYFICEHGASTAVERGFNGVLAANIRLYDGLLESISAA